MQCKKCHSKLDDVGYCTNPKCIYCNQMQHWDEEDDE